MIPFYVVQIKLWVTGVLLFPPLIAIINNIFVFRNTE